MTGRRALFISAYFPSADIPAAGNRLAASALRAMVTRCEIIDVVAFQNPAEAAWRPRLIDAPGVCAHIHKINLPARLLASFLHPTTPAGSSVRRVAAAATVRRLTRLYAYEEMRIEFTQAADVLPRRYRSMATLRVHDVMADLYGRQRSARGLRGLVGELEWQRVRRWEPSMLCQFGRVLTLSSKDADAIRRAGRSGPTDVEPPADYYTVLGRTSATVMPDTMLFWANYGRSENEQAARFMAEEILPLIRARVPAARMILAGASPPSWSVRPVDGVSWTGFVDSPDELFRSCTIGVVPLLEGAGVKIKVLEFLSSGIPTVATSVGAEGIEPTNLLHVADGAEEFAGACVELLVAAQGSA